MALGTIYLVIQPSSQAYERYLELHRPRWFNFESKVTWIWLGLYICFYFSARLALESRGSWTLFFSYLALVVLAQGVNWLVCTTRSPRNGVVLGAVAWLWALILLSAVAPVSAAAAGLLVPYLLWGPVAIIGLLQISKLNPAIRRSRQD
ncbi:tryptophan-rich sensory protein [Cyanobium sp. ATX 6F1]|uniref:tryptophan-rich sensory protein n=1 Tax=Cyanobium sp. ATX 6F1 TaxID=2823702 RepID=UPI0020CD2BB5|nr:tryptophan-rich sensory protein [Cyanobium sp. ATX 6F1]MCP9915958.1 tryptophan-rich sensory protein [Cyanobium sp. ATX 6F1]